MEHNFEANFFAMLEMLDGMSRREIEAACTPVSVRAQEVVYEQNSPSSAIYIIASGVVEALTHSPDGRQTRSVAYMSRGDFFGDLGVLTGNPRVATIRACEATKLFQIDKTNFLRLLEKVPKLGVYLSRNLARRLYKTSTEAHQNIYSQDLAGNLQHFDLLTIFQAISSMGRSGELRLSNSGNDLIGSFFFREGDVEFARFMHLEGVEAIWQGFVQSATEGAFTFRVMDKPTLPFASEHAIHVGCTNLLMQGVSQRDIFQAMPQFLREMRARLQRVTETLAWTDPETEILANRIWELIAKRSQPLDSLWRRGNYSAITFLNVVNEMTATRQADLLTEDSPG